jgi:hypothetical protein
MEWNKARQLRELQAAHQSRLLGPLLILTIMMALRVLALLGRSKKPAKQRNRRLLVQLPPRSNADTRNALVENKHGLRSNSSMAFAMRPCKLWMTTGHEIDDRTAIGYAVYAGCAVLLGLGHSIS